MTNKPDNQTASEQSKPAPWAVGCVVAVTLPLALWWIILRKARETRAKRRAKHRGGTNAPLIVDAAEHLRHLQSSEPMLNWSKPWQVLFPPALFKLQVDPIFLYRHSPRPLSAVQGLSTFDVSPFEMDHDYAGDFALIFSGGPPTISGMILMRDCAAQDISEERRLAMSQLQYDERGPLVLWMEHRRTFMPPKSKPAFWPDREPREINPHAINRFAVLRDPLYSKNLYGDGVLIDSFPTEQQAISMAAEHTNQYRISTCVAQLIDRPNRHQ